MTNKVFFLTKKDGLPDNNLMGVVADEAGNIWIKGIQFISKYLPHSGTFWAYNASKDMKEFNTIGASVGPHGHIVFHGNNGFYLFHPDSVRLATTFAKVVLTDHIPIILLTAKVDEPSKLTGIQEGADLYLPKPFNENELLGWIENRLKLHAELRKKYHSPVWLATTIKEEHPAVSESERLV